MYRSDSSNVSIDSRLLDRQDAIVKPDLYFRPSLTIEPFKARESLFIDERHGGDAAVAVKTDAVTKSFNTWSFKREQPSDPEQLAHVVGRAIASNQPIDFVLYWGKGPRQTVEAPDTTCLDYLRSMADRIRRLHAPGAAIRLILTDTHAALNGHPAEATEAYFAAVRSAAEARGFGTDRLGDVVARAARAGVDRGADEMPSVDVLRSLVASATKWYRGEGSVERGARDYHRINMAEKRAVEHAFPGAIFATFNGSEVRDLFPAGMPIFYMYSLRKGVSVKPWFLAADGAPADLAPAPRA